MRTAVELCLFDPAEPSREIARLAVQRAHRPGLACPRVRAPPRRLLRLSRARPLRARRRPSLQSGQAAPRPLCARPRGQRRRGTTPSWATGPATPTATPRRTGATARPYRAEERGDRPRLRLAGRPPARHALAPHGDLRGPREGLDGATSRRAARPCAAPIAGLAAPPALDHLRAARRHRGRAPARASRGARAGPRRARAHQLLGLQLHRLLRPRRALRLRRVRRGAGRGVQVHGARAAPGRPRGHPRRGLQSHRRGHPSRPHACLPRHRQPRLLPARSRAPPRRYLDYTGCGNTLNTVHPRTLQLVHGQSALLGAGHARGRLPLRPRHRAGPPAARLRPVLGVLRGHPGGSRDLRRSSSSPSPGTPGRAATRWGISRPDGRSGTAGTATRCGAFGGATPE